MWTIEVEEGYLKRAKDYRKRWSREHDAVLDNFDTYMGALNEGANPLQTNFSFVHGEGAGAIAIDERHHGQSMKATRLYVYPESELKIAHVITLGDKGTQKSDVKESHQFIASRKKELHDKESSEKRPGVSAPHFGRRGHEAPRKSNTSSAGHKEVDGGSRH